MQIWKLSAAGLPRILVDPDQLTQALVNLALNGIQAMSEGGVLKILATQEDDGLHIAISDTGSGIPAEQLQEIFRPFYTTKYRGTGLGLAISRGIVERNGGRLEVESEPGQGSTFTLIIETAAEGAMT